jgi:protein-tyrosine phosphatase
MFKFIENSMNEGRSVLVSDTMLVEFVVLSRLLIQIHCLAGAHRAGTTGIASLMYFAGNAILYCFGSWH